LTCNSTNQNIRRN